MIRTSKCSVANALSSARVATMPCTLVAQKNHIAGRLACLTVAARDHICNAVLLPLFARQVLDDDTPRPERLRSPRKENCEHAVLKALDIDFERIHPGDACIVENPLQCQRGYADGAGRRMGGRNMACSEIAVICFDNELAVRRRCCCSNQPHLRKVGGC